MSATKLDIERAAEAIRARYGYSVRTLYLRESSKLPYCIQVFDPKSTKSVEVRPASIAAAVASLIGIADGVWMARGKAGNYPK